ncbi:MAG: redoxin domain-containing protein [Dongiaceae bacterium]
MQDVIRIASNPIIAAILQSQCVGVGEFAPDFELLGADGRSRQLEELIADGPLVILFLHGRWCPVCLVEMERLRQQAPEISAAGANFVAIAPDWDFADNGSTTAPSRVFMVADPEARIASVYGLTIVVPPDLVENSGLRLPAISDNGERGIVAPAVLIVDRSGVISWMAINPDHARLDHATEAIQELRRLSTA